MSKENAKAFVQAVLNDEELREKTANMKPEDAIPFAKEMGYEFTLEELKEVKKEDIELSPDELENAAGGHVNSCRNSTQRTDIILRGSERDRHCYRNPNGPLHQWEYVGHKEEPFLGGLFGWTTGFDVYECTLCKMKHNHKV